MAPLLDDLVEPFERVAESALSRLLADAWGLRGARLTRLDTERDDSFRAEADERTVVVKVAHPNDSADLLDLQDTALATIAASDPSLPVPRPLPALDGRPVLLDRRIVRVLGWLPGSPAGRDSFPLRLGGELLGRLNSALAALRHPAADRVLPWDLRHVPELAGYTDDPLVLDSIARYAIEISPILDTLPRQIAHSDFHPDNVLIDDHRITGVIDFGDIVSTPRICDVGVALGYLVPDEGPMDAVRREFLAGFESIVPLTETERALLPGLVVGRLLQRIVINDELGRRTGERANTTRLRRSLDRALEDWQ